ncbi:hypothetical protein TIFTF001_050264 [Ficus carica]|uniref:HVA22-like protein n=1 Tax=Ficus carica TaxID=3494 RepID=A0AA87YTE1_FICCA|nr:hypothetical protein TIFTF001_050261 [Ficus carica]GMN23099.1 hypothetical protein TIFTF001_050262 [Ficus carica]GMN23111.1 hypothetical protein TIFTF001_050263 [Ficus carica]GMN23128.1 hypothetical protein TIFTF001_050264 [Ficus carica]
MIGSFITRGLVMVLGYAYPAYECYKTVEKNKPEIEQLLFWCQYWILVAFLTVCERAGDAFISWVPMYCEVKLLFFIYLWHPRMKGTTYVYDSFFKPYLAKHENDIDRNLLELRTRAGDIAVLYWQRAASYGQTRVFDILQYVAAQSTPRPRPPPQQQGGRPRQPPSRQNAAPNHQPPTAPPSQPEEPPSPTSSTSSSQYQKEIAEEMASSEVSKSATQAASSSTQSQAATPNVKSQAATLNAKNQVAAPNTKNQAAGANGKAQVADPVTNNKAAASNAQKPTAAPNKSIQSAQSAPAELEPMQTEAGASSSETENGNPPPNETVMEDAIRDTRGRFRKTRSTAAR